MTLHHGVIGNPIKHSLSPMIHEYFANEFKLDIHFEKYLFELNNFSEQVKQLTQKNVTGLNVTVPFKTDAFNLADELTENAKLAGAVNTLKLEGQHLIGENTDGMGLVSDIRNNLTINLKDKIILIVGAGGATRGIIKPLLDENIKELHILNRTEEKAIELAAEFSQYGEVSGHGIKIDDFKVDIIINATSSSLDGEAPQISDKFYQNSFCYDLMYGSQTPFMVNALNNDANQVFDGLGMLVEQAAKSFEFWTGKRPESKKVINKVRERIA